MITSWQPINNSFYLFTFFFSISNFFFIRFVLFRLVVCAFVYCILYAIEPIRTIGVSKCAHAFDFNRLNSTLRRYVSLQNNCKSKIVRSTSLFVIQTNFVAITAAVVAFAVACFCLLILKFILQETEF